MNYLSMKIVENYYQCMYTKLITLQRFHHIEINMTLKTFQRYFIIEI